MGIWQLPITCLSTAICNKSGLWSVRKIPLNQKRAFLPDYQRLELVCLALGDSDLYKASNVEFGLPKPSRTVDTLAYLYDKHPDKEFSFNHGN
jgi:nicotinic acid mononucleotide adenylyltransferase